ncbi:hypothetical protein D3C71_2040020 [compost metagenome]
MVGLVIPGHQQVPLQPEMLHDLRQHAPPPPVRCLKYARTFVSTSSLARVSRTSASIQARSSADSFANAKPISPAIARLAVMMSGKARVR